jgi:transcriptional regulator with XRE-family HTH domain
MSLGERLKHVRKIRNMAQCQLSEKSKLPISSIAHIENGDRQPNSATLTSLCNSLDCSADYLLGITNRIFDAEKREPTNFDLYITLTDRDQKLTVEFMKMLIRNEEK